VTDEPPVAPQDTITYPSQRRSYTAHGSKTATAKGAVLKQEELMTEIYVGGLPYGMTESQLRRLFTRHGKVESVRVIMDWFTGKPRGFAFVEMSSSEEAMAAISALNRFHMDGGCLTVNEVEPRGGRPRRRESAPSASNPLHHPQA
jgi:RNA recognition motif-containing protein